MFVNNSPKIEMLINLENYHRVVVIRMINWTKMCVFPILWCILMKQNNYCVCVVCVCVCGTAVWEG